MLRRIPVCRDEGLEELQRLGRDLGCGDDREAIRAAWNARQRAVAERDDGSEDEDPHGVEAMLLRQGWTHGREAA